MRYKIRVLIERDNVIIDERYYNIKCDTYEGAKVIAYEKAKMDLPIRAIILNVK